MLDSDLQRVANLFLEGVPSPLKDSVLYSLLGPGKRIRPRLVLAVAHALHLDREIALRLGTALEMTHAYTLIHDDLPAMDNDDFRRGKPTNHQVYGEATALLAGDSLALLGCDVILSLPIDSERRLTATRILLEAAGVRGVIAGQASETNLARENSLPALLEVFRLKTGALFRAALTLPIVCDSTLIPDQASALTSQLAKLGEAIGIAFQIADDLEDDFSAARKNPAHVAHYLDARQARDSAFRILDEAFAKLANIDPSSVEFRLREELHPFLEELRKKLET